MEAGEEPAEGGLEGAGNGSALTVKRSVWPSLGVDDACSVVCWGQVAGVHWHHQETATFHARKDGQGKGVQLEPVTPPHLLVSLPQPGLGQESTTTNTGDELAAWTVGSPSVAVFPAGNGRDEIAAARYENRPIVSEADSHEQATTNLDSGGTSSLQGFLRSPKAWHDVRTTAQYKVLLDDADAAGLLECRTILLRRCLPQLTVSELQKRDKTYVYSLPALKLLAKILGVQFVNPYRAPLVDAICAAAKDSSSARGPSPGVPIEQIVASAQEKDAERTLVAARAANAAAFYEVRWDSLGPPKVVPMATIRCAETVADVTWNPFQAREAAAISESGGIQLIVFPQPGTLKETQEAEIGGEGERQALPNESTQAGEGAGSKRQSLDKPKGLFKRWNTVQKHYEGEAAGGVADQSLQWQKAQATGVKRWTVQSASEGGPWWHCVFGHDSNTLILANRTSVSVLTLARGEDIRVQSERGLLRLSSTSPACGVAWEPRGLIVQEGAETVCALARPEETSGLGSYLLAVGTSRRVLLWDVRKGSAPLLQWDHGLAHAPPVRLLLPSFPLGSASTCHSVLAYNTSGDLIGFKYAVDASNKPSVPLLYAVGAPFRIAAPSLDRAHTVLAEPAGGVAYRKDEKAKREQAGSSDRVVRGLVALPGAEGGSVKLLQLTGKGPLVERTYADGQRGMRLERTSSRHEDASRQMTAKSPERSPIAAKAPPKYREGKGYYLQPVPALHAYISSGKLPVFIPPHSTPTFGQGRTIEDRLRAHPRSYLLADWEGPAKGNHFMYSRGIKERLEEVKASLEAQAEASKEIGDQNEAVRKEQSNAKGSEVAAQDQTSQRRSPTPSSAGRRNIEGGVNVRNAEQAIVVSPQHLVSKLPRLISRSLHPQSAAEIASRYVMKRLPRAVSDQVAGPSHAGTPGVFDTARGRTKAPQLAANKLPLALLSQELGVRETGGGVAKLFEGEGQETPSWEVSARSFQLTNSFDLHGLTFAREDEAASRGGEKTERQIERNHTTSLPESPLTAALHRRVSAAPSEDGNGVSRLRVVPQQQGPLPDQGAAALRLKKLRSSWQEWQQQKAPFHSQPVKSLPSKQSGGVSSLSVGKRPPNLPPAQPAWLPRKSPLGKTSRITELAPSQAVRTLSLPEDSQLQLNSQLAEREDKVETAKAGSESMVKLPQKRTLPLSQQGKKKPKKARRFTEGF